MKILKNKKGIALETAIIFMVMIFSFCFLLATIALMSHYRLQIENIATERKVGLDQIGEDFIAKVIEGTASGDDSIIIDNRRYDCSIDDVEDGKSLTVNYNEKTVLYVETETVNSQVRVKIWRYSPLTPTE